MIILNVCLKHIEGKSRELNGEYLFEVRQCPLKVTIQFPKTMLCENSLRQTLLLQERKKKYEPPVPTRVGKKKKKMKGPDTASKLPQGTTCLIYSNVMACTVLIHGINIISSKSEQQFGQSEVRY